MAEAPSPTPSQIDTERMMTQLLAFMVVLMTILGGSLCVVGIERLIRGRFSLFSTVRALLRCTFLLFIPLQSYLLAQNQKENDQNQKENGQNQLVVLVLLWMLLIALIRKKVLTMVQTSAGGSFSRAVGRFRLMDHSDELTQLVWIGYVIYTNTDKMQSPKEVAVLAILWSLALAKLGHSVLNHWKVQDSLAAAGNTHVIAGYMQHVLDVEVVEQERGAGADIDVLAKCKYAVMGEEKLVLTKKARRQEIKEARRKRNCKVLTTPHCGYGVGRFPHDQDEQKQLHLLIDPTKVDGLVTLEKMWGQIRQFPIVCCLSFADQMRMLCFSFSLYKLLRRRFERYPMVEVGSEMSRRVMLHGVLAFQGGGQAAGSVERNNAISAFRVLRMELDFLDNYYQAGVPVVMSAPLIFVFNFLLSLLFVFIYFFALVVIVVDILGDEQKPEHLLTYVCVALLLMFTLLAIEVTEFLTSYLLSNWFLVHLLSLYVSPSRNWLWNCLCRPIICCIIVGRFVALCVLKFVLRLIGRPVDPDKMKIRQVSVLQACEPIRKLLGRTSDVTLATEAKVAIVKTLKRIDPVDPSTTSYLSLPRIQGLDTHGKTTIEIILACHLATELLEIKHGKRKKKKKNQPEDDRTVATTLSRYCMYLVARAPELLPDDEKWVSDRYDDVKSCLKEAASPCCCGVSCTWETVVDADPDDLKEATTRVGVELFQQRKDRQDKDRVWEELAGFWVELVVYLAPSNDVEGHAKALASSGGDLITCLWAFCTHAGITRQRHRDMPAGHKV